MPNAMIKINNISFKYQDNELLKNVNFELKRGEIQLLLGLNGAGKSTLVRILSGISKPNTGELEYNGQPFEFDKLRNENISFIYDEPVLFNHLNVADNICAQSLQTGKRRFLSNKKIHAKVNEVLTELGANFDSAQMVYSLNLAQKRIVEFARILYNNSQIIVMDEPFEALSSKDIDLLVGFLQQQKTKGRSILITTHRIDQLMGVVDRISVIRNKYIMSFTMPEHASVDKIVNKIAEDNYSNPYPKLKTKVGKSLLHVENLSYSNRFRNINFDIHEGEIVGIYGNTGSGRSSIAKAVFGDLPDCFGRMLVEGEYYRPKSPQDAIRRGIAYIPDDRSQLSLFGHTPIYDNLLSAYMNKHLKNKQKRELDDSFEKFFNNIKPINMDLNRKVVSLSGGMQQIISILKWLLCQANIFIFDEPTISLDVVAKNDIYNLMNDLVRKRAGILLISSNANELLGMCDRILILNSGNIINDFVTTDLSLKDSLNLMLNQA